MSDVALLWIAQGVAAIGWIALLAAPKAGPGAVRLARAAGAVLALSYLALFLTAPDGFLALLRDYSPETIGTVFDDPRVALIGWVPYLAFDLWVGAWEADEAARTGVAWPVLAPCLVLTCLVGPIGLLAFLAARRSRLRLGG